MNQVNTMLNPYAYIGMPIKNRVSAFRTKLYNLNNSCNEITISNAITAITGVSIDQIVAKSRADRNVLDARKLYCFYVRDILRWPLKDIGRHVGGRDHTTIIHNIKIFHDLCHTDEEFKYKSDMVAEQIKLHTFKND